MLSLVEHGKSFITLGPNLHICGNFGPVNPHLITVEIL